MGRAHGVALRVGADGDESDVLGVRSESVLSVPELSRDNRADVGAVGVEECQDDDSIREIVQADGPVELVDQLEVRGYGSGFVRTVPLKSSSETAEPHAVSSNVATSSASPVEICFLSRGAILRDRAHTLTGLYSTGSFRVSR